jgi:hypothetical protein
MPLMTRVMARIGAQTIGSRTAAITCESKDGLAAFVTPLCVAAADRSMSQTGTCTRFIARLALMTGIDSFAGPNT